MLGAPWWILLLAAVGAVALVAVLLGLFSNLGEDPETAAVTGRPTVDSDEFLDAVVGTTNASLREGGSARLLENGDEIFPALFAALEGARRTINFMVYIWEPGALCDRLFDLLEERARAGVEVRVMADGLGARKAPKERIRRLRAAGGRWCWFHPIRFGQISIAHRRNHRRVIVIDGEIGFTGGAAIADKWLGHAQDPEHWRDAMVEVRGPLAASLQPAFVQLWSQHTGELLTGPDFFPATDGEGGAGEGGEEICRHLSVLGAPSPDDTPIRRVLRLSFHAARESIYIVNPYFVPDRATRAMLTERARAGVDVRALVPNEHNDVFLIRWASQRHYEGLLEGGVRIYEYQPTMIHQKHVVVDGRWSIVGTANMDVRSEELNQECVLGIQDRGFAAALHDSFVRDLERAREIRLDEWRRRPAWRRVPERFFGLFEEQF